MKMLSSLKSKIKPEQLFGCLILFIIIIFLCTSCRKWCRNIEVPDIICDKHLDEIQAEILDESYTDTYFNYTDEPLNFFITDSVTYDSIFYNYRPLGNINFDEQFIIGIFRRTNEGFRVDVKAKVCEYNGENKLKLTVRYSLYDQCAGSGISRKTLTVWAILPNIYINYKIVYDVVDINPWPY